MNPVAEFINSLGLAHPITYLGVFLAASLLMIWRLDAMMDHGLEGTALGTLVMPYCSGLGNLIFVFILLHDHGEPREVMINCLVNNVTNLTLVLGVPAILWTLEVVPPGKAAKGGKPTRSKKPSKAQTVQTLSRLSLLLTMLAVAFFTGTTWALGLDGKLDAKDGLVLVGIFLFWQCFQVFDVLKRNVQQRHSFSRMFYLDLLFVLLGAALLYASLDWLVHWITAQKSGFLSAKNLGWLSGWLMVLPNALIALYYGAKHRADIVYSSQIGDGHICIPLCLGLFTLFRPMPVPPFFERSMQLLFGALIVHFVFVLLVGRLPRWVGGVLVAAYAWFVYTGLLQ